MYEPDRLSGKVPLVLHLNGHERVGKSVEYKQQLSINLAKRGMLVLDLEWLGMGQLNTPGFSHYRMNQLDVCGASGLAPFYLALSRALDVGLALEQADPARVAAMGLSGGGWQTILISSLDPRVVLANPVAGYGGFRSNILCDDMGDSEQVPTDMATVADYTHLTALRAGRPTLLTYNASDDCCFKSAHTLEPLLAAAGPAFSLLGASDKLRSHVNHVPGTHNFEQENREQFYAMLGDFFYPGDASFARGEMESRDELKTAEELSVPLPDDNADFHRLAVGLLAALPAQEAFPHDRQAAAGWQVEKRKQLRDLLKVPDYNAAISSETAGALRGATVISRQLRCGDAWTIPSVEFSPQDRQPRGTAILVADAGRASIAPKVERLLRRGDRVLAIDPLGLGESSVHAQDPSYLYPLFLAAVGERPLGIQAAQLVAVARLFRTIHARELVTLVATGPRAAMAALVAGALETEGIQGVELTDSLASLAELIERDQTVQELPELFAFGLAAEFDMAQISALVAPRHVTIRGPGERARRELAILRDWYRTWGEAFDPLAATP